MVDQRDFVGTGWAFPLRVNRRGGLEMIGQEQNLDQSILLILSTPLGQRRMRPRFGCAIHDLVFSPNGPATHGLIRHYVLDALALWEPRVEVQDVDVYPD